MTCRLWPAGQGSIGFSTLLYQRPTIVPDSTRSAMARSTTTLPIGGSGDGLSPADHVSARGSTDERAVERVAVVCAMWRTVDPNCHFVPQLRSPRARVAELCAHGDRAADDDAGAHVGGSAVSSIAPPVLRGLRVTAVGQRRDLLQLRGVGAGRPRRAGARHFDVRPPGTCGWGPEAPGRQGGPGGGGLGTRGCPHGAGRSTREAARRPGAGGRRRGARIRRPGARTRRPGARTRGTETGSRGIEDASGGTESGGRRPMAGRRCSEAGRRAVAVVTGATSGRRWRHRPRR